MKRWIVAIGAGMLAVSTAGAQDAEDWYPSKYGPDDRLGAVNNLSPEKTAAAAKLTGYAPEQGCFARHRAAQRGAARHADRAS